MNALPTRIKLTHRIGAHWSLLPSLALLGTFVSFMVYVCRSGGNIIPLISGSKGLISLKMTLFYYVPFECISIAIFIQLLYIYHRLFKINYVQPTVKGLLRYTLLILPLILVSILIFGPITNTIRYFIFYCPACSFQGYFPEFFMTSRMYFNYLLPILVVGYIILYINLFVDYTKSQEDQLQKYIDTIPVNPPAPVSKPTKELSHLDAFDKDGQTCLPLQDVYYIEVEAKSYLAFTAGHTYKIRYKLAELETELPAWQFCRINRSVMINLAYVKSYHYWENDKYIVRLKDNKTEFIMQRARLSEFKNRLDKHNAKLATIQVVT